MAAFAVASALVSCAPDAPPADEPGAYADSVSETAAQANGAAADPAHMTAAGEARAAIEAYVAAVSAMDLDSAGTFYSDATSRRKSQWAEAPASPTPGR